MQSTSQSDSQSANELVSSCNEPLVTAATGQRDKKTDMGGEQRQCSMCQTLHDFTCFYLWCVAAYLSWTEKEKINQKD